MKNKQFIAGKVADEASDESLYIVTKLVDGTVKNYTTLGYFAKWKNVDKKYLEYHLNYQQLPKAFEKNTLGSYDKPASFFEVQDLVDAYNFMLEQKA